MKNTISDSCIPLLLCAAVLTVGLSVAEQFVKARSEMPRTVRIEASTSAPGLTAPDEPLVHANMPGSATVVAVPVPAPSQSALPTIETLRAAPLAPPGFPAPDGLVLR